ncbi:retrovirus-related pol polyprotein from transposon TNT 1-94 [Tanacetum coccineum]|uniref:Retrovirus-related pol polyprotein from transposon TNT 1-94 n=1 Tax=Tanacetum coccineum TaxID=301880 RepID=A0ABQ5HMP0_9ASTR
MASDHVSSNPVPQCPTMALEQLSLSPVPQSQENVPQAAETESTSNELDLLFSLMFDELLNGSTQVVSRSSIVNATDIPEKCQQQNITQSSTTIIAADAPPLNILTLHDTTSQAQTQAPTVTAIENINQAETQNENAQVEDDEFINIFSTPVQERGETSPCYADSSNMHTFYQYHPFEQRWTKDHPLEQVIGNHSQSVRTRRQLKIDDEMCMFALTVSRTKPKNIKEAMADSAWIEAMQEELYQFDRLYGLKQAPRAWYDALSNFLISKGFSKGSIDPTLFITKHAEDILLVQIYVDDIIFDPPIPRGIFINQAKYAQEILKNHGMISCDSIGTPMATKHLDADLSGTPVNQTKYRSMVGALMYLTASRPDIIHATCYCARYQAKPTQKHLTTVKRIFWYLKDTINMGFWYPKDISFELTAFLDLDHAGCLDSRKSTSGGIQFLGGDKTQLIDYGFHFDKIPMYYNSKVAIAISCNPVQHSRTKHIDVRYYFIKEHVEKGIVKLFFVETEYQLADLFTKVLPEDRFKYLFRRLGMRCLTPEELEVLANESA